LADVAIGLDLGTGGVRVLAVDFETNYCSGDEKLSPFHPQPGWTEQNPSDWVRSSLSALSDVTGQLDGHRALALGLSGQMHGMVALNAEGRVIRPAILWNDQRTGKAVAAIEATISRQELIGRTGNPMTRVSKLVWLRTEEPQAYAQVQHCLLPKDYLGYVLTSELVTDPSVACGVVFE